MELRLARFHSHHAAAIAGWPADARETEAWAGSAAPFPLSREAFAQWRADPDLHPFVCLADDELIGYGEIWVDRAEREIELARIIIAPPLRSRGFGQAFVRLLLSQAGTFGLSDIVLRVLPENVAAIRCYDRTGFACISAEEEQRFNESQPRAYVWMRYAAKGTASEPR